MKINEIKKKAILDKVNELCPSKGKLKYSNEYILEKILLLLNDISSWRSFSRLFPNTKANHYTTIRKRFHKWSNAGVFNEVYDDFLKKTVLSDIKYNTTITCYVDATLIENRNGIDKIGFGENKKKKATKLTAICDDNKRVLEVICEYEHDSNMVLPIVDAVSKKVNFRKMNLVGDKGYKVNQRKLLELQKKKVKLHVPKRRNEKTKTSEITKKHLQQRYKIEHVFQQLKTYSRIRLRSEKKSSYFMGFVWISLLLKSI